MGATKLLTRREGVARVLRDALTGPLILDGRQCPRAEGGSLVLSQLRRDFRERRNIDVYTTIFVAVLVAILSNFELISPDKVTSLILIVLATLALNTLATRTALENQTRDVGVNKFTADFPPDLRVARDTSSATLLIGVSLSRTIETSYAALAESLERGCVIRVLVTSPEADDAAIDARCKFSRPEIADQRAEIERSLRQLQRLASVRGSQLQVKTTKAALKFGLNYVNVGARHETLYVQLYSFRLPGESRPHFALTRADGEWFDCYRRQAEALWDDADRFQPKQARVLG